MSLKEKLRSERSKRFDNVARDCLSKSTEISSEDESVDATRKNKVRNGFSSAKLTKKSKLFTTDKDHICAIMMSPNSIHDSMKRRREKSEENAKSMKKKCFSKNAIMARLNRERKKKYVSTLEAENESLRTENCEIKRKAENQKKKISLMKIEILYLKGLLANSKELGHILLSLKDTTGLPVTSSMVLTSETGIQNKISEKLLLAEEGSFNQQKSQPRLKFPSSSCNFSKLDEDINLENFSHEFSNGLTDLENHPWDFERDSYDVPSASYFNDENSLFNFDSNSLDSELEECLKLNEFSGKSNRQVGICLHVNQKRISVEFCSICSSKAESVLNKLPDDVFSV